MNLLDRSSMSAKDGILYFEDPALRKLGWVTHAFLTRQAGIRLPPSPLLHRSSKNGEDQKSLSFRRDQIARTFGFESARLVLLQQVHQDGILVLKDPAILGTIPLRFDAIITHLPNQFLGICTADCIPILIVDPVKKVIAALHAGRQGTALQIMRKVLRKMREGWHCVEKDLLVTLGPSIGPCCYEIDEAVFLKEWEPFSIPKGARRWMLDLAGVNIAQMVEEGIQEDRISQVNLCTRCNNDLFFSYRREGNTGRQLSFVGMGPKDLYSPQLP